ncbi:MAG: hypothetical protein SP4CHLAM5_06890 [Chlamydiia bacterium]|nr:hypothetical protein [Chlamydiia bacterium]MCH9618556.1 hypothetical protein [Chlamydiia bacterium]MCH9624264.1 hypothetical protein [Chlamydiia bacterium]
MNNKAILPLFIAICHIPIFLLQFENRKAPILPKKKITINTIHLLEEHPKQIVTARMPAPKKTVKKVARKKKKIIAKKAPAKKKKKPILSKKKIQKKLSKSLASKKPRALKRLTPIKKTTKNDAGKEQSEYNKYLQEVAAILSDTLTLPETGKVKLSITIRPGGTVSKITSLSSESACNLAYLEEHLAKILLPKYSKKEDRTFTIVFSDEK